MERKRTFHSLFLASTALVLFLILALSVVSASPAQRVAGQLTLTETQITTNKSSQEYPAIYGDRIVWEDNRDGQGWKLYI